MEESLNEKEGVPHFTKDGKEWKGKVHKMPDGSLMSGNPHDENGSGPNDYILARLKFIFAQTI